MRLSRGWGLLLALLLWVWPVVAEALPQETWVVAIGNNRGDASDLALLFAERDARELADVLRNQGNVASDRVRLLIDEDAGTVRRTLGSLNSALRGRQQEGGPATALIVFYSGHADAEALHLRGTHLAMDELRGLVTESPATVRLFIVDACRSGAATRVKGARAAPEFAIKLENRVEAEGTAIISSSTADESSQESDRLRGSFFSHHLVNALRGAADRNDDGRVTLAEAYAYTYAQTLRSTGQTLSVQHPTYAYAVKGSGELTLTTLGDSGHSAGRLRLAGASTYLITEEKEAGAVVAEVTTPRERALLTLPPGRYFVQQRDSLEYREYQVQLQSAQELSLERLPYRALRYDQLVRKRGGARSSVHGILAQLGVRGQVLAGEGPTANLVLGYTADLPWLTAGVRVRASTASLDAIDNGLSSRRYELGLSGLLLRYVDLPWLSFSFGVSIEGFWEAQRFADSLRVTSSRNSLGLGFGAPFALERRLLRSTGLSLRLEGGPLALLVRRGFVNDMQHLDNRLTSQFTYWVAGGVVWRL